MAPTFRVGQLVRAQAIRYIRTRIPPNHWPHKADEALQAAANTAWGKRILAQDPRLTECRQVLQADTLPSDTERVGCLRDLEELHSLAHVMNRTRRRDIGRFTIREPRTVSVSFTPGQQQFYDALIAFRRDVLALRYDARLSRLVTDTLERQAASCLPALIPALDAFLVTGRFSTAHVTDASEEDADFDLTPELVAGARELRDLAAALAPDDPKLQQLLAVVQNTLTAKGPGKVLVFSFFLHTLRYLEAKLRAAGCRVGMVSGDVPSEDEASDQERQQGRTRERLRERFRLPRTDPEALDVLLSSELGPVCPSHACARAAGDSVR